MSPSRLVGNFAAIIGTIILAAVLYDRFIASRPVLLCYVLQPLVNLAGQIGVLLTTVGVIDYTVSMFKSEKALGLAIGGVLLFLAPMMMPHYMGASCIP